MIYLIKWIKWVLAPIFIDTIDSLSVEENNEITTCKVGNTLASYDNGAFEGADLIDNKEMMSSTSTLIGNEKPDQLLDSFTADDDSFQHHIKQAKVAPVKLSIEATLCEQAETNRQDTTLVSRADSNEISDEELVEYPKSKEIFNLIKPTVSTQLICTSPASQTESNVHLTSSASAQTIPTSGSEYVTCKSGATSNVTSAASYLTANDSTLQHSKTLSVSNSDSTLSSDSGTLIDERYSEEEPNYELLDITPTKQIEQLQLDKLIDLKDEEEDEDSSSTGDPLNRTIIISNAIKEPYETEIPISVICNSSLSESFIRANTIEQQQLEFEKELQIIEQHPTSAQTSLNRLTPRVSLSEQSDTSIETAIYRGSGDQLNQSGFSSLESNQDSKNDTNIRDEPMPIIMATGSNLDQWDDSTLDEEMIIHEDMDSKKSDLLYTLEEEEESRTEDGCVSNKLIKDLKHQRCSSADNSSSLMEFERLEKELDRGSSELDIASKLPHYSSLDSIGSIGSTGILGTPKLTSSNTPQSENSSLNEFERLENECQEQIKKQLTEIEEGHESQASDSAELTISGCSQVRLPKEEDDTSEIDFELNANLDAITSCPSTIQMEEDLEDTPVHQPQKSKTDEEYDEEILKIVTTTENRIIEEVKNSANEQNDQSSMTTRTTMKTMDEFKDGQTTQTTITTTTTTTTTSTCITEDELNKYLDKEDA